MGQETNTSPPNSTHHFRGPAAGRARWAPNDGIYSLAASVRHYTSAEEPQCRALSSLTTYQSVAASKSADESLVRLIRRLVLPRYRFVALDGFLVLLFLHWIHGILHLSASAGLLRKSICNETKLAFIVFICNNKNILICSNYLLSVWFYNSCNPFGC